MGFFSLFDTAQGVKQGFDRLGNQPQYANPQGLMGGASTYRERADARNLQDRAAMDAAKQKQNAAENAAFQKQANPLDPAFAQGQVTEAPQQEWENMQRRIYGG